jgi:hypothetical protein
MQAWCVDCLVLSTKTDRLYDLGAEGWRAVKGTEESQLEWRCPDCWPAFKEVMGGAVASSARFRAAAAIDPIGSGDAGKGTQSGEHTIGTEASGGARRAMIEGVIREIFDVLSLVPVRASSRALHLLTRATKYELIVSRWSAVPASEAEQIAVFEKISRLRADAQALAGAYHRAGR